MTLNQGRWVIETANEAQEAKHVYALMAAAEAALESNYGQSAIARLANNLFGMKQHKHSAYGTFSLPTREFLDGEWTVVNAEWVKYPSFAECFAGRMETLYRLRDAYPHYDAALKAPDPETYVREISKSWSTDPQRAEKVLAIYRELFAPASSGDIHFEVT